MTCVRRCAYLVLLSIAAFLAAGCAGIGEDDGGEGGIAKDELKNLVLQRSDLPPAFMQFDYGEQTFTDFSAGPRGDPDRFGRQGGWKSRYRRPGTTATSGPLVVVSMVDAFTDADGARRDLDAYRQELSEHGELSRPRVGSEAVARAREVGAASYYDVAWRRANLTAFISASGFEGKLTLADAIALARKQDRRISDAASG